MVVWVYAFSQKKLSDDECGDLMCIKCFSVHPKGVEIRLHFVHMVSVMPERV